MILDHDAQSQESASQLKRELMQREAELDILTSVQLGLAERLDVQSIYDLVGDKIREIFNPDVVMLSTYDPLTNTVEHRYAIEAGERIYAPGHLPPGGFRGQIVQTRQPLMVNENVAALAVKYNQPTIAGTVTPKSWLGVPMLVGGQVTGILSLQSITREHAFKDSDMLILQTLAASMSVALENARMWEQEHFYRQALEREFEIGRNIQAGFLPDTIPQPEGWEISTFLKPAREVAGDFYDVFKLSSSKLGLVIADVCDKGLGAALFMTLVRSLLRVSAGYSIYTHEGSQRRTSIEQLLLRTINLANNYIAEMHGKSGMFATAFLGILDTRTGVLKYVNCGHIPPMLVGSDGAIGRLPRTGMALGAMPNSKYETASTVIDRGTLFFAYTDGLTDALNLEGKAFDIEHLLPIFSSGQELYSLCDRVHGEIEEFSRGVKQFDDITMLVVKRS